MAEGITLKRIIDMDEATELTSSDYALVDSATGGPKKFALGDELSSLKEDLDDVETALETKAEIDGYYEDMTVGNAEQLVSTVTNADDTPYNFRTTAGSVDVGDRAYVDGIVGGSLVWNQLFSPTRCQEALPYTHNGITYSLVDGDIVLNGTATANSLCVFYARIISGHKYLRKNLKSNGLNMFETYPLDDVSVVSASSDNNYISISVQSGTTLNNYIYDGQIFDLTQMFGSTIADYIYSLEQATAGAGVAWFRKLFPKPYYAHDAGSLQSVQTSGHKMVGFNQFDKSTAVDGKRVKSVTGEVITNATWAMSDYIRVMPNTVYYTNAYGVGQDYTVTLYDANKNYIGYRYVTSASTFNTGDANYVILSTIKAQVSVDALVLNLSWDGERNGEYEPYVKHSYPLDSDVVLRGIPKLDAQNNLYYDGDEYLPDGTVTRRYGYVNLGNLEWSTHGGVTGRFTANLPSAAMTTGDDNVALQVMCPNYTTVTQNRLFSNNKGIATQSLTGATVFVYDPAYSSDSAFTAAMSGVMLVYELATPTTEEADPYQQTQICDDFGTEEFISTSPVPVGHNTRYAPNLRAKLEMSPDSPDGDGVYVVQQSNGENEYIPFGSTAVIQDILARLTALEGNTNEG